MLHFIFSSLNLCEFLKSKGFFLLRRIRRAMDYCGSSASENLWNGILRQWNSIWLGLWESAAFCLFLGSLARLITEILSPLFELVPHHLRAESDQMSILKALCHLAVIYEFINHHFLYIFVPLIKHMCYYSTLLIEHDIEILLIDIQ